MIELMIRRPLRRRDIIQKVNVCYKKQISRAYNKKVRLLNPSIGAIRHIQKGLSAFKSALKLKEPYIVREGYDSVYFLISGPDSGDLFPPINAKWTKL